jgi:biopolymer transport protein ExbB/biopolymer transport protein TolQ
MGAAAGIAAVLDPGNEKVHRVLARCSLFWPGPSRKGTLSANKVLKSSEEENLKLMLFANIATLSLAKAHMVAFWLFQEDTSVNWSDPISLVKHMGWPALTIVGILFVMSAWSIGVMIDRWISFSAARKQSRQFAPLVAGALREGKLDEAIRVAERNKKSHLAKVVTAGLQEFKAHGESTEIPGEQIEASKRALERAEAIVHAELKRGLGGLATIGSTAPFVGLLGTVIGILNAFNKIAQQKATGLGAVAGGISEALVTTALGLFVAIPAVMMFNYFTGKVEAFDVEMDNSSSELVDYFLKRTTTVRR